MQQTTLEFVNHASVLVRRGEVGLLSDPWYTGAAFHKGWRLVVEQGPDVIGPLLDRTTHIWLSHEHPDHLSIAFFRTYAAQIKARGIEVLFQHTDDERVLGFLRKQGFATRELPFDTAVDLGSDVRVTCFKDGFYDSGLLIDTPDQRLLNLNDCEVRSPERAAEVFAVTGPVDVLLSQFSYAAWKGGPDNRTWRLDAAREKLDAMRVQVAAFQPTVIVPFASFVWFANERNFYLNDGINRPEDVPSLLADLPATVQLMQPGDVISGQPDPALHEAARTFWKAAYDALPERERMTFETVPLATLREHFGTYVARIHQHNARWLMRAAKRLSPIPAFQPVTVFVDDLDLTVRFDVVAGTLTEAPGATADLVMGSESLDFLFKNTFGFDTLTVNGCFEEGRPGGFLHASKTLAVENLNNMGIHISPRLALRPDIVRLFLSRLRRVGKKLRPKAA